MSIEWKFIDYAVAISFENHQTYGIIESGLDELQDL